MTTVPAAATRIVLPRSVSVTLAIGRVEARKLLRHPAMLLGVLLSFAITVMATWKHVPVLNRDDALTNETLIPVAVALLVAAHLATMRSRRYGTTELFEGLATSDVTITAGHVVSVLYVAGFTFVLVFAELTYMKAIGGASSPRPVVIFSGAALVAFAGAFGVALGRWAPRLFAAPVGMAGLVAFCIAVTTNTYAHDREWLSLWVMSERMVGVVSETTIRPYAWRVLYLAGLAALAIMAAVAHDPRRRAAALALALVPLAVTAYAGSREMGGIARSDRAALRARLAAGWENPRCREYASVAYCPMPGYEAWIDYWRKPTEGVLVAAPPAARPQDLRFLQAPGAWETDDPSGGGASIWLWRQRERGVLSSETDITPTLSWGRHGHERGSELAIALMVAARTIDVDHSFKVTEEDLHGIPARQRDDYPLGHSISSCTTLDQGRAVVGLWLAAQATEGAREAFEGARRKTPYLSDRRGWSEHGHPVAWGLEEYMSPFVGETPIAWGARELSYADQLLGRNDSEVRRMVAENWVPLTDPATTSDQAAAILGLSPLPPLEEVAEHSGFVRNYWGVEQLSGTLRCR